MDMLKEFTKNREQEQRLDAPSLEYLEKENQWCNVELLRDLFKIGRCEKAAFTDTQQSMNMQTTTYVPQHEISLLSHLSW